MNIAEHSNQLISQPLKPLGIRSIEYPELAPILIKYTAFEIPEVVKKKKKLKPTRRRFSYAFGYCSIQKEPGSDKSYFIRRFDDF